MKRIVEFKDNLQAKLICAMLFAVETGRREMNAFLNDEEGDTNFISILVILGIVAVVAAAFILFKNQVLQFFNDAKDKFFG